MLGNDAWQPVKPKFIGRPSVACSIMRMWN